MGPENDHPLQHNEYAGLRQRFHFSLLLLSFNSKNRVFSRFFFLLLRTVSFRIVMRPCLAIATI